MPRKNPRPAAKQQLAIAKHRLAAKRAGNGRQRKTKPTTGLGLQLALAALLKFGSPR